VSDGVLRIGELARRTGLTADVIRAWERRYDLLHPTRSSGNYRLYSSDDLSRLRLMQHYLGVGLSAAEAAGLVHRVQTAAFTANPGLPPGDVRRAQSVLRDSLERFDEEPANRALERLLGVFAPGAVVRDVVLPYLRELGERWACGEATVAQEHFASGFIETWMLGMARGWGQRGERCAVLACLPGERHTLGLVAFGLALRDLGWRVTYLGADAPLPAVAAASTAVSADAVVVSCALPGTFGRVGEQVRELARAVPLAVGGAGVEACSAKWLANRTLPADPMVAAQALTATIAPEPAPVGAEVAQRVAAARR
jgi:MerR family transcriptional regulator, light-induced transcriptional regulator